MQVMRRAAAMLTMPLVGMRCVLHLPLGSRRVTTSTGTGSGTGSGSGSRRVMRSRQHTVTRAAPTVHPTGGSASYTLLVTACCMYHLLVLVLVLWWKGDRRETSAVGSAAGAEPSVAAVAACKQAASSGDYKRVAPTYSYHADPDSFKQGHWYQGHVRLIGVCGRTCASLPVLRLAHNEQRVVFISHCNMQRNHRSISINIPYNT